MHIDNFDKVNFDFDEMKIALADAEVIRSAFYFDESSKNTFLFLEVGNYDKYLQISKKKSSKPWSNLLPIKDIDSNETPVEYAWNDVFHIDDENN